MAWKGKGITGKEVRRMRRGTIVTARPPGLELETQKDGGVKNGENHDIAKGMGSMGIGRKEKPAQNENYDQSQQTWKRVKDSKGKRFKVRYYVLLLDPPLISMT